MTDAKPTTSPFDPVSLLNDAAAEVYKERLESYKAPIKAKMREIAKAEDILANLKADLAKMVENMQRKVS